MTTEEFKATLKDALGVELKPGTETVVFVDADCVNARDIDEWLGPLEIDARIQFAFLMVPDGKTINDCLAVVQVPG